MFFPIGPSVLLPWIQTSLSSNLKLFSIIVRQLFEPIVFWKKGYGFFVFVFVFVFFFVFFIKQFLEKPIFEVIYGKKRRKN